MSSDFNRRDFLKSASTVGATLGLSASPLAARPANRAQGRVLGANDRINIGVIGVGGRGSHDAGTFARIGTNSNQCQIVAVCDVWQKRVNRDKERFKCDGYLDYREVLARNDVDAVVIATPDHWHAKIALEAMDKGKDVYLEKPMCHTVEEARQLCNTVRETKRVLQVGSQTTSGEQWHQAKKAIADGMIGRMLMSQGSYHRNSIEGEWNWPIDKDAGPEGKGENYIDWKTWLGPAPKRPWSPDRYFRFRKYWDYSGGIATDLFFHVAAPMNICWGDGGQFPHKVMAAGGIYQFKNLPEDPSKPDREVPDTFHLMADYPKGHSIVLTSSMANRTHIPGTIRGHGGTIVMVEHGMFESYTPYITIRAERVRDGKYVVPELQDKYKGETEIKIPIERKDPEVVHATNFLDCMRSRQKPTLDVETASRAQVLITLAVMSYREGRVLYFDEKNWKVTPKPVKV